MDSQLKSVLDTTTPSEPLDAVVYRSRCDDMSLVMLASGSVQAAYFLLVFLNEW